MILDKMPHPGFCWKTVETVIFLCKIRDAGNKSKERSEFFPRIIQIPALSLQFYSVSLLKKYLKIFLLKFYRIVKTGGTTSVTTFLVATPLARALFYPIF